MSQRSLVHPVTRTTAASATAASVATGEGTTLGRRLVEAIAVAIPCAALYWGAGAHFPPTATPIATPIDAAIPFLPDTVWFYLPGYAACFLLTLGVVRDRDRFHAALGAFFTLALLSFPFFVLYPVAGPRPPTPAGTDPAALLMQWLHGHDPVGNTFPSLHVANSALCAFLAWRSDRRVGALVGLLAIGVAVSTLTLKQHWLVDIPAGLTLAGFGVLSYRAQLAGRPLLSRLASLPGERISPRRPRRGS